MSSESDLKDALVDAIVPDIGATCFGAVVVITMFAAGSFDPRIIWDRRERAHE